jgi:hypothetical protein
LTQDTFAPAREREVEELREPAKEPSKAWRNKWRIAHPTPFDVCGFCGEGHVAEAADEWWACATWPSKEIAESKAGEVTPADGDSYIGAFPVPTP